MKRVLFALLLFTPIFMRADCYCDDQDYQCNCESKSDPDKYSYTTHGHSTCKRVGAGCSIVEPDSLRQNECEGICKAKLGNDFKSYFMKNGGCGSPYTTRYQECG